MVAEFADREFQRRVWLEQSGPEVSSCTDAMQWVLEDASEVDGALGRRYGLTREQIIALREFRDELSRFEERVEGGVDGDDFCVVSDPDWVTVVEVAIRVTELCKAWRHENCAPGGYALADKEFDEREWVAQ